MRLAEAEDLKVSEMALTGVSSKKKVPVRREETRMVGIWLVDVFICGCFRAANFWERTFSCLKCWQACTFCELWIFVTHGTSRKQIARSVDGFFFLQTTCF